MTSIIYHECGECGDELLHFDTVTSRTRNIEVRLYECKNEDCTRYNVLYNDWYGDLNEGDPTGMY